MTGRSFLTLALISILLVLGGGCEQIYLTVSEPSMNGVQFVKSQTIKADDAEFQAIADQTWSLPVPDTQTDVNLGLRITNRATKQLRFSLATLRIVLTTAEGKSLLFDGGNDAKKAGGMFSEAVAPNQSLILWRRAKLKWLGESQSLRLIGSDDLGGIWYFDGLSKGNYTLSFDYQNTLDDDQGAVRVWRGRVLTVPLHFTIH